VGDFEAEDVVAGAQAAVDAAGSTSGAASVNGARILERATDDPQLARAIQEARRVLGSK
jgi:hypothetical protein